jgi:hypothetical protein
LIELKMIKKSTDAQNVHKTTKNKM